jgi:hypothetical protein
MGWVVVTPWPLYPQERAGTHCIRGWMGPKAGLDRCRKSRLHQDVIPGLSGPYRVAISTELSQPTYNRQSFHKDTVLFQFICIYFPASLEYCTILYHSHLALCVRNLTRKTLRILLHIPYSLHRYAEDKCLSQNVYPTWQCENLLYSINSL